MPEPIAATLSEAAGRYLDSLSAAERKSVQAEVQRFVRWCGADRMFADLRGQEVANYGETLTATLRDGTQRADAARKFLAFAKKAGYTSTNMGTHLRVRKLSQASSGGAIREVELTEREKAAIEQELEGLKAQRPRIRADIQRAMADKDFRENAPLDAAKQEQAFIEGRIRNLEASLANVVIVEEGNRRGEDTVGLGSTVLLRNLSSGRETKYTLVRPSDVSPGEGRISADSPVGRALVERRAGDEVDVEAPAGSLRFRIERVEQ